MDETEDMIHIDENNEHRIDISIREHRIDISIPKGRNRKEGMGNRSQASLKSCKANMIRS